MSQHFLPRLRRPRCALPKRRMLALGACVAGALALLPVTQALALHPSEFSVDPLCGTPAPGRSSCLGLELVANEPLSQPDTSAVPRSSPDPGEAGRSQEAAEGLPPGEAADNKSPGPKSLSPSTVLSAYGLTGVKPPSTQTIALVDAYDAPTIASDLEVFSTRFSLPPCNESNGCFRKVNQTGASSPLPELNRGWATEISTDVEVAHGLCPSCQIVLVEAKSNKNKDLYAAEQTAAAMGANEISNSWGGEEPSLDNQAFNHPGIVITASAGDDGYLDWLTGKRSEAAEYPASSPHVVGVGGTRLNVNTTTGVREGETVWNDGGTSGGKEPHGAGGGGCSAHFAAMSWQTALPGWAFVGCGGARAVADVSADADPYTGVAVYDSTEYEGNKGWAMIGGTSVAAPIIASVFALAGGSHGVAYPTSTLYENALSSPSTLHDVVSGSNGECFQQVNEKTGEASCSAQEMAGSCSARAICLAGSGYDGPTGVGTPNGLGAFEPPGTARESAEGGAPSAAEASPQQASGTSAPGTSGPGAGARSVPASTPSAATPIVSALRLTRNAIIALNRKRPKISKVGFAFTLSAPARVRVTISRRVRIHGHLLWKTLSAPVTILASRGAQSRRLSGHAALAPGRYRLTLAPEHGVARSIAFQIH